MAESSKTLRQVLLGKVHRATVTRADLDYVGSITIDEDLLEGAGLLANEKVDIYDITNGSRLATYVIPAARGSGEVGINGAAAHLVKPGDLVIIAAYGWMKEKAARRHQPRVLVVDRENRPVESRTSERNPPQDPFGRLAAMALGADEQDEAPPARDLEMDVTFGDVEAAPAAKKAKKKKGKAGKKASAS
jgi:aspartate 1-decarboxylase